MSQGRYRWRRDKVLRQIADQEKFLCDRRVNNPSRSIGRKKEGINFVPAGQRTKASKVKRDNLILI